ncbi:MAG: response regulator [Cyanobacteria bacterium P01_F01_bin.53]
MKILPSCAYYLRRLLRKTLWLESLPDLLQQADAHPADLSRRLYLLYLNGLSYEKVVLHLEQLVSSHQHAKVRQDQRALIEIIHEILWWLGYGSGYGLMANLVGAKIFIVDDSLEILKLTKTLLTQAGYVVESALSGQLALNQVAAYNPDLILLDVHLPDMDGYQVYQRLRRLPDTAQTPVVFLSGVDSLKSLEGEMGHLAKPFSPRELLTCVRQSLVPEAVEGTSWVVGLATRQARAEKLPSPVQASFSPVQALAKEASSVESMPLEAAVREGVLGEGTSDEGTLQDTYFFRATLAGSFLRVSSALVQRCGYDSPDDMMAAVKNVWSQTTDDHVFQTQWKACLDMPNQVKIIPLQLKTQQNGVVNMMGDIWVVRDKYGQCLFYQGCMSEET